MRGARWGIPFCGAVLALAACGGGAAAVQAPARPRTFTVPIYDAAGLEVGVLTATQTARDSVRLVVQSTRIAAGTHGTHLHAVGTCEGPDFQSAGAHLDPAGRRHGLRNPQGPHLGDLPNLVVGADRQGRVEATVAGSLTPGQAPIFDADGTALVVHAAADDQVTDPSGNSGARIACAVIAAGT